MEFIDTGALGDSANWVETCLDGSCKGTYASKGYIYDAVNDEFVRARPSGNFEYDTQLRDWVRIDKNNGGGASTTPAQ